MPNCVVGSTYVQMELIFIAFIHIKIMVSHGATTSTTSTGIQTMYNHFAVLQRGWGMGEDGHTEFIHKITKKW